MKKRAKKSVKTDVIYPPEMTDQREKELFRMGWEARIISIVSKGGRTKSAARAAASRANGSRGGRPLGPGKIKMYSRPYFGPNET